MVCSSCLKAQQIPRGVQSGNLHPELILDYVSLSPPADALPLSLSVICHFKGSVTAMIWCTQAMYEHVGDHQTFPTATLFLSTSADLMVLITLNILTDTVFNFQGSWKI